MKKILVSLLFLVNVPAMAQHHYHHGHWQRSDHSWNWIAPAIIGGAVVYTATRQPVVIQQTPPPVIIQQQNCGPWIQVQNSDGTTTISRTCNSIQ